MAHLHHQRLTDGFPSHVERADLALLLLPQQEAGDLPTLKHKDLRTLNILLPTRTSKNCSHAGNGTVRERTKTFEGGIQSTQTAMWHPE